VAFGGEHGHALAGWGEAEREGAAINAELRCYVEVQAPNSYTRLPQSTDLPRYLEL
jgi:hypothetical protein